MPPAKSVKSLILFASGKGSNAQAIIRYFHKSNLASVTLIVCNNANAGVLDIAKVHNIPFLIIDKQTFQEKLMLEQLREHHPDLIVLAGFLWKIPDHLLKEFPDKIINIHPALLPKFGGKGMYGQKVHEAVLAAGETETGITIHFVNENYDEGAHIVQAFCRLALSDTPIVVAEKVSKLEQAFYPKTIEYLLNEQ
ncbi:MAG: phosphoribosylglycinamide formyltransferase [Chitinophagaceae bacterium]|jgi:phosphoribosylglycinamide formyltransferase-1